MFAMSNGDKCYREKKMSWSRYAGREVRATMKASHLSRHLKEGRVWTTGITWEKNIPERKRRKHAGPEVRHA